MNLTRLKLWILVGVWLCGCMLILQCINSTGHISPISMRSAQNDSPDIPIPIQSHKFNYIIQESDICSSRRTDIFILTVVHSYPLNYKRRLAIRETWGSFKFYSRTKMIPVFFLGSVNDTIQMKVNRESEQYRDIIQEDFIDSYRNLTFKAIMWLKWVHNYCSDVPFVLKVDDDVFVNSFTLVTHVTHLLQNNTLSYPQIFCLKWTGMPIMRDTQNKWYVSDSEFSLNSSVYPEYCSGSAYLLTRDAVPILYKKSLVTKFMWVDDVYVTGIVRQNTTVQLTDIKSLFVLNSEELFVKLLDKYALFGHNPQSILKAYQIWSTVLEQRNIRS